MELKTEDQLVPVQTPVAQETKKRGRPRKLAKPVCSHCNLIRRITLFSSLFLTLNANYSCRRTQKHSPLGRKVMTLLRLALDSKMSIKYRFPKILTKLRYLFFTLFGKFIFKFVDIKGLQIAIGFATRNRL